MQDLTTPADSWWSGLDPLEQDMWRNWMRVKGPESAYAIYVHNVEAIRLAADEGCKAAEVATRRHPGYEKNPYDIRIEPYLFWYWQHYFNSKRRRTIRTQSEDGHS